MILTLANVKGGAGKTTTAMHIAHEMVIRGQSVFFLDADRQRSASRWSEHAQRSGEELPFNVDWFPSADLIGKIEDWQTGVDHLIIDTAPGDADVMLAAMSVADLVLIPANAGPDDEEQAVKAHRDCENMGVPHFAVLNRVKASEITSIRVGREMLNSAGVKVLNTVVGDRVDYRHAFGSSVDDTGEYSSVLDEIEELIRG